MPFVAEADIVRRVKEKTTGLPPTPAATASSPTAPNQAAPKPSPDPVDDRFPYATQNQGVYLEVTSLQVQGETLNLAVSLRNEGTTPIRFLYGFLTVTDNRGQSLGSRVESLPSELPAVSESFNGRIEIPEINVKELESIDLELADYPDQQITLRIEDIPVKPAQN